MHANPRTREMRRSHCKLADELCGNLIEWQLPFDFFFFFRLLEAVSSNHLFERHMKLKWKSLISLWCGSIQVGSRTKVSGLHRLNNPSYKVAAASFHFSYLMRDFRPVISAGLFLTTVRSKPRPHHRFMSRDAPRVTTYHFYPSLSNFF